jgi:hypothetical protein
MFTQSSEWLTGSPWWIFSSPFPHITAEDVFSPGTYAALSAAFDLLFESRRRQPGAQFYGSRTSRWFDADIIPFVEADKISFPVMLCPEWHKLLAGCVGVEATADIDAGLHHHEPRSANGWIHNDLNPGWFPSTNNEVNLSNRDICDYRNGAVFADCAPIERVRVATMIFFLNNENWEIADGGETGLYESALQPLNYPSKRIPPKNNSLLLFECTPRSYHAFLSNHYKPRNSIILWLHTERERTKAKWGLESLVQWA